MNKERFVILISTVERVIIIDDMLHETQTVFRESKHPAEKFFTLSSEEYSFEQVFTIEENLKDADTDIIIHTNEVPYNVKADWKDFDSVSKALILKFR